MKSSAIRKTLIRAKELLIERGWIQKRYYSSEGICATEAIYLASKEQGDAVDRTSTPAYRHLTRVLGLSQNGVSNWNDTRGSVEEVFNGLDKAIDEA